MLVDGAHGKIGEVAALLAETTDPKNESVIVTRPLRRTEVKLVSVIISNPRLVLTTFLVPSTLSGVNGYSGHLAPNLAVPEKNPELEFVQIPNTAVENARVD